MTLRPGPGAPMTDVAGLPELNETTEMPNAVLPSGALPEAVVPIRLPRIVAPVVNGALTPLEPFPEMTFPSPGPEPPTVAEPAPFRFTPSSTFGIAALPAAFVPIRFPWMTVPVVVFVETETPLPPLPEMTFPGGA